MLLTVREEPPVLAAFAEGARLAVYICVHSKFMRALKIFGKESFVWSGPPHALPGLVDGFIKYRARSSAPPRQRAAETSQENSGVLLPRPAGRLVGR